LPPEQCRVVQMSFFEDKSHGEISEELNIPLGYLQEMKVVLKFLVNSLIVLTLQK